MDIVEDKTATIKKADAISNDLITHIMKEIILFQCPDDPAEHIYLSAYTIGLFVAKMAYIIKEYAPTYGIEGMTAEKFHEYVQDISKRYIETMG